MSQYVLEVEVRRWNEATRTMEVTWRPVRPTGGREYRFETRDKAERVRKMCYPHDYVGTRIREVV